MIANEFLFEIINISLSFSTYTHTCSNKSYFYARKKDFLKIRVAEMAMNKLSGYFLIN